MAETRGGQAAFEWAGQGSERQAPTKGRRRRPAPAPAGTRGAGPATPALPPDDELWDVHAAAQFLRRSVSWVYHKAEDGSLPVRRLGGWGLRFIPGELRAWVAAGGEPLQRAARRSEE
jgi:predicted DNA-binding transcriptional regulator AlpA